MSTIKYLALILALFAVSCGIFDPRLGEYPSNVSVNEPFKFESLLYGTNKKFTQIDYRNGIFGSSAFYIDINGVTFDQEMIAQHLYDVRDRFKLISISWTRDSIDDYIRGDTFFFDRKYHIVAEDTLISPSKTYDFNNKASFKMTLTSTQNEGSIFYWKDNFSGKSIFHPQFQPDY